VRIMLIVHERRHRLTNGAQIGFCLAARAAFLCSCSMC
jgi:hypothetical protein